MTPRRNDAARAAGAAAALLWMALGVLLRLSRKVDPEELFPGREFPWR